jgi:hypothetical protein
VQPGEPALVRDAFAGEEPPDELDGLVRARAALGLAHPHGLELALVPPRADAEDHAIARQRLQRRELLAQQHGVTGRQDEDGRPEANPRGRRGRVGQAEHRVKPRRPVEHAAVKQVVGCPHGVESQLLGPSRERGDLGP